MPNAQVRIPPHQSVIQGVSNRTPLISYRHAGEDEDKLAEGIERLARVIRSVQKDPQHRNQTVQPTKGEETWEVAK